MSGKIEADEQAFQRLKEAKKLQQEQKQIALRNVSEEEWRLANERLKSISSSDGLPLKSSGRRSLASYALEI